MEEKCQNVFRKWHIVKILLIEDNETKSNDIIDVIQSFDIDVSIEKAASIQTARRFLLCEKFDLIIFDMLLPDTDGAEEVVNSTDILMEEFAYSNGNMSGESILITQYPIEAADIFKFNASGVVVVQYDITTDSWKKSLENKISKIIDTPRYDFLIFCALYEERQAYSQTDMEINESINYRGIDCQCMRIGQYKGLCITPHRMGPLSMSIIASRAFNYFQPKLVMMSGICAGVKENTNLLDLIIGDITWDYQTGKRRDGYFISEPYQTEMNNTEVKTTLKQISRDANFISDIKKDISNEYISDSRILFAPMVSGSAVISDILEMERILEQHRKLAGLDMEMAALYEAAHNAFPQPLFFGAKTVVDFADSEKGDALHIAGSILSARFITKAIPQIMMNI